MFKIVDSRLHSRVLTAHSSKGFTLFAVLISLAEEVLLGQNVVNKQFIKAGAVLGAVEAAIKTRSAEIRKQFLCGYNHRYGEVDVIAFPYNFVMQYELVLALHNADRQKLLIGIQESPTFSAHFGPTAGRNGSWGEPPPGQPGSSRRKSTLLAVPSLLDEKELHDEKEFLKQMRAGPPDRRFPLFVGLRCMLFHRRSPLLKPVTVAVLIFQISNHRLVNSVSCAISNSRL